MQNEKRTDYYLGLDIGTDSVGYAVTGTDYAVLKFRGEPMWGTTTFEGAVDASDRRKQRISRRRYDRRQQRVKLVGEIFAEEIGRIDPGFFRRLEASRLYRDEAGESYTLFNDPNFTDKDYYREYPPFIT